VTIGHRTHATAWPVYACIFDPFDLSNKGYPPGGTFSIPNPYNGPPTQYFYVYTDPTSGCKDTAYNFCSYYTSCWTIITPKELCLKLYNACWYEQFGMMKPILYNNGLSSDPYLTDSVRIELRDPVNYSIVASANLILNTNGTVCWVNEPAHPLELSGCYYIVVKTKNGIKTWSSVPVCLNTIHTYYDFSDQASKAFGSNQIELNEGIFAFYCGDVNQDENIDLLDMNLTENDVNNFLFGYIPTDLNGDGNVDLMDYPILEQNISTFIYSIHP
ncbi:MAG TPA: hypothetical protein PLP14_08290, partial [Chitinophagaceae bacterium]|nr:hypothetical protein [Chitinophagaceae bacterium]